MACILCSGSRGLAQVGRRQCPIAAPRKNEEEFECSLSALEDDMGEHAKRAMQLWGVDGNADLIADMCTPPAMGTRIPAAERIPAHGFDREIAMAQGLVARGMVALSAFHEWDEQARDSAAVDASGMASHSTLHRHVFGTILESRLDYVITDWRSAARVRATDSIALAEAPFATDHKALGVRTDMDGVEGWSGHARGRRRRPARSMKAWQPVDLPNVRQNVHACMTVSSSSQIFSRCVQVASVTFRVAPRSHTARR